LFEKTVGSLEPESKRRTGLVFGGEPAMWPIDNPTAKLPPGDVFSQILAI